MTEKKENVQLDKNIDPKEREKLESVRKADAAVKTMQDFTSPEVLYQELIASVRKYHPSTDISMIQKAYEVASDAHKDQKRKSGEPYIIHPLCVAIILADLELDKETIVAGLLHDAVEDTWMTTEEVEKEFSAEVALLVDGVTKLGQLSYSADKVELQAENLRKMFLAMAKDIRVILIKLADGKVHDNFFLQILRNLIGKRFICAVFTVRLSFFIQYNDTIHPESLQISFQKFPAQLTAVFCFHVNICTHLSGTFNSTEKALGFRRFIIMGVG